MSEGSVVNERIAARRAEVTAARRRRAGRRVLVLVAVAALAVGAVALERSSLVALASLEVAGVDRLPPAAVRAAADVELGTSVLRISPGAIQERVEALPLVERATVERDGALGLLVTVEEVAPALTARFDDRTVLLDEAGLVLGSGSAPGTPVVDVPGSAPRAGERAEDAPPLVSAHAVLLGLPGPVAGLVDGATVAPDGEVELGLEGGVLVRWGDETRPQEKARALGAVLEDLDGRDVRAIDVRAPSAPTVVP